MIFETIVTVERTRESNKLQRKERSGKSNRIAIYVIKAFPRFGKKEKKVCVCMCLREGDRERDREIGSEREIERRRER